MEFNTEARAALLADPIVFSKVGDRMFPVMLPPEHKDYPALTIYVVTTVPEFHLRGSSNMDSVRIQIDVWSKKYTEAKAIAKEVRRVIEGINGITIEQAEDYEPETKLFRILQQYNRMTATN